MCKRCAERSGDPRLNAFQPFFVLTTLTKQNVDRVEAETPGYAEQQYFTDNATAQATLDLAEKNDSVVQYVTDMHVVCLN